MRDIQRHGSEQSPETTPEAATEGPLSARRPAGGARDVQTSDRPSGGRTESRTHTEPKERDMTDQPADGEVRQLLVHPKVWPGLELWLAAHGISLSREQFSDDVLPTYVMTIHPTP